ncbi:hypothetical protein C8Q80DRAFT_1130813 [Daedaleopsis nitida]|nr:hypothetical protein C8Q80DRAFT_1130813 [Daedaleopsis nitida]
MAEAGPSLSSSQPSTKPPTSSHSPPHRNAHVQFPVDNGHSQATDSSPYGSFQYLGLGPPPVLRQSGTPGGSLSFHQDDKRRRVKSVDASNAFEQSRPRNGHASSTSRRTTSFSRKGDQRDPQLKSALLEPFSDEYDLSREDPGVLEDVQRALRAKARREARLRTQSSPLRVESLPTSDIASLSSTGSSPRGLPPIPHYPRQPRVSGESQIDFSPSVGVASMHPVPSSSDGGATLDWSTSLPEDGRERRWSLSKGKRKSKDYSSFASKSVVEKQDALYRAKLAEVQSRVTPLMKLKAKMITRQIARKYQLMSYDAGSFTPNLLDVTRWYRRQPSEVRSALDDAEPSAWMKHLWDKQDHRPPPAGSSAYSPTALVMEEYAKAHAGLHSMGTILENEVLLPASPHTDSFSDTRSPSVSSYGRNTPRHSLEAAISRKRSSYDVQLSFEPLVESGRDSGGPESKRSSDNYKGWKSHGVDSAQSSLYSMISRGASPNSSRKRLRDLGKRITGRPSDEALSSGRNSISEHSASEDGGPGHQKMATLQPRSRPTSLQLHQSPMLSDGLDVKASTKGAVQPSPLDAPTTATQSGTLFPSTAKPTPRPDIFSEGAPSRATLPRRRYRRSLPSLNDIFARERENHRRSANEQKEREEYEVKAQVLEDILSQNHRIRHLLQRVCTSIRDYDSVQAGLSSLLGIPYMKIPPEVLDAFLHDPSAVTGGTRRAQSWKAVEDIHERIERQRETLQTFVHSQFLDGSAIASPHNVFDDPIAQLLHALDELAIQRQALSHKAEEVTMVLNRVKMVHAGVKKDYNDTLAHTSLVYPELSQIAALEENHRNQFQQFWDIGLDALTLLLDTVTPFWRNYGKVIGEDVQDFLIIPWYRNEFTGEPKRYLIRQFPRRSLRHWVGLLFLSFLSMSVTILQTRAAVSLTININMPWISQLFLWWISFPIYIILLLIQWCAVLFEISIILAQTGVVVWWLGWSVNLFT